MKRIVHLLFTACIAGCTLFISAATILEKQLELGKDPKTRKTLVAKGYAFVEGKVATPETLWLTVYPYENDLYIYASRNNVSETFSVSNLIATQQTFDIILDPITKKEASSDAIQAGKPLLTIHMNLDAQVQIFRDIVILIAQNDKKNLAALIEKHSLTTINEIIERAVDCQCICLPFFDDIDTIEKALQQGADFNKPLSYTGKVIFLPVAELTQELLNMEQENRAE